MAEYKEEQIEYCRNCLKQHKCKDWRNIIHGCPEYEPHILVGTLTKGERDIVDYLEKCYVGARMVDDVSCMVRIARALAAFKFNPQAAPDGLFSEKFLEDYTNG